jgi:hypothetical protein
MRRLIIATALCSASAAAPAWAANVPPSFSVKCGTAVEGQKVPCVITKSAKAKSYSQIQFGVVAGDNDPAAEGAFEPTSPLLTFGNNQLTATVMVQTRDDSVYSGDRHFIGRIANVRFATIAPNGGSSVGTITDNEAKPVPVPPTPTPTPTPTPCPDGTTVPAGSMCPMPVPVGGYIPTPSLHGLPDIASEFDPLAKLIPAWGTGAIPPSMGADPVGAFRFVCGPGQVLNDDPIQYPGQRGKSHAHQFFGNLSANGDSTFESLRKSGETTCGAAGFPVNRSAYWNPAMLDGRGHIVSPDHNTVYYKRLPESDPLCHPESNPQAMGICVQLPNGLRYIAGSDLKGGYRQKNVRPATQYATPYRFSCNTPTGGHVDGTNPWALNLEELGECPVGNEVVATIGFPDCWDGKNLDSPDHGSHMDYAYNTGQGYFRCDDAHPYVVASFLLATAYSVREGDDVKLWSLSSDGMDPTKPRGWSLHGDWFGAWDPTIITLWHDKCINGHLSGTGGDLCDGRQIPGMQAPSFGWSNPNHLLPIPSSGM